MSDKKRTLIETSPQIKDRVKKLHEKTDGVTMPVVTDAVLEEGLKPFEKGTLKIQTIVKKAK